MSIQDKIQAAVHTVCTTLYGDAVLASLKTPPIVPPKDPTHGDYAITTAMALSKVLGRDRIALAQEMAAALQEALPGYAVQIAGPGFINLTAPDAELLAECHTSLGADYGRTPQDEHVILEFGSANPTGPLHIGHARGLVIGSALASLLRAAGKQVTTEYYVNDAGAQVGDLAKSVLIRAQEEIGILPKGQPVPYSGDYTRVIAAALVAHDPDLVKTAQDADVKAGGRVADFAIRTCMDMITKDLDRLGVHYDAFISEAAIDDQVFTDHVAAWAARGLVETKIPTPLPGKPAGAAVPMFLSSQFGDDQDRVLVKSSGVRTYFGNDAVNHARKAAECDHVITLLGEDHGGYVSRISAVVKAVNPDVKMSTPLVRMVHLMRDGVSVNMSKRAGTFETVSDLLDEVPSAAVRMSMLTRGPDSAIVFDLAAAVEDGPNNPVWGVNYAYARLGSALAKSGVDTQNVSVADVEMSGPERRVAQIVADWPRVLQASAEALEPHRVASYARDLADAVNGWWSAGQRDPSLRLIQEGDGAGTERRALVAAGARSVLFQSLGLIGVIPEERMEKIPENVPEV